MIPRAYSQKKEFLLLISLFIFELSLAVMAMAMYIKGERPFAVFLSRESGVAFLCAIGPFFLAGWVIVHQYLANKRSPSRHFRMIVTMNLITVLLIVIAGEIAVRAGSQSYSYTVVFGNVELKPRDWERNKLHYRQLFEKSLADHSLLVYDDRLGWTVGQNRYSAGYMGKGRESYASSAEGIRAPHEGVSFPKVEGKTDIALVGDSFTYGGEVSYEESWGYVLNQMLGEEYRVLNFGVSGYGLDQAYLRYEKDVTQRSPKVVILGFIEDDLVRTMKVYPFLSSLWNIPFSKPRFVLRDGEIVNISMSTLPPEEMFSRGSISELPFLEYDGVYRPSDWQKRWYHVSYLVRLFLNRFPSWSAVSFEDSEEELVSVNAEIFKAFIRSAKQAGAIPLVVFFPTQKNINERSSHLSLRKRVLELAGIAYIDSTPCLLEVPPSLRFAPDSHYSPQGNAAVAKCLVDAVREALGQPSSRQLPARG